MKNSPWRRLLIFVLALGFAWSGRAYDLIRYNGQPVYWNNGPISITIKLGTSLMLEDESNYSTSAQAAMEIWNAQIANVQFVGTIAPVSPATDGGGGNEMVFNANVFGDEFGAKTVAVATTYYTTVPRADGSYRRTQSDIVFNSDRAWGSYRGPARSGFLDIRRVAIHELGHVLGLDHPDEANPPQTVLAVMNSTVGDVDSLRQDDINGGQFLYGAAGSIVRPANDRFADAALIALNNNAAQLTGSNVNATKEPGEPNHAPDEAGGTSIWWRFTAPATGSVQVHTRGSSFDTLLAGYAGPAVGSLLQLAANDDEQPPGTAPEATRLRTSLITFNVAAGLTYHLAVDGWEGETGAVQLSLTVSPLGSGGAAPIVLPTAMLAPQAVSSGLAVSFGATPLEGAVYQWQISQDGGNTWTNLTEGGFYNGTASATLTISGATAALNNARYRYVVTTVNGSGTSNAAMLTVAPLVLPFPVAVAIDSFGNLFVADTAADTLQRISSAGVTDIFAGLAGQTGTADGTGSNARFNDPGGLVLASNGIVTVTDTANGTIRRISTGGVVSTLAGSTTLRGNTDGVGTAATFSSPLGITQDSAGNIYVADAQTHTIRRVTSAGVVTTFAGMAGSSGTADGTNAAARFNSPQGIAIDGSGLLYVADTTNNTIRRINAVGAVSTIAGLAGVSGSSDGTGADALFNLPTGLAVDGSGNVYVADTGNSTIRRVTALGVVTTVAGLPGIAGLKDGAGNNAWFNQPRGVTVSAEGDVYVADTGNAIVRRISGGVVTSLTLSQGATTTPSTPTTPTVPSTPTTPTAAASGGGGGGAPSVWFLAALVMAISVRWCRRRI